MESSLSQEFPDTQCRNCGTELQGKFCHSCGQKKIEQSDRTIKFFFVQFLGSAFFLENNFFKNVWYVAAHPGRQPLDFIDGKQRRWMPPFSLFLLINLFYFWYTPLSDMNLRLYEQLDQYHAPVARSMVKSRLEKRQVTLAEYEEQYNAKSSGFSNSLIVLHVPLIALVLMMLFWRRNYFFVDYFVVGLYFMAFLLLMALTIVSLTGVIDWMAPANTITLPIFKWGMPGCLALFTFIYLYNIFKQKWWLTALKTMAFLVLFFGVHMAYRTILFFVIFAAT